MEYNKLLYMSMSMDPWYNLATEEALFDKYGEDNIVFYLWRNHNTVVVGRNQNALNECKCDVLESNGGKLARRITGGGAVFHDEGNLNFTFIMPKDVYNVKRQLKVILNAVRSFGIEAEFTGRNDLTVNDRKFSGNAFCIRNSKAFHHGTILMATDMSKLSDYLKVSKDKIKSKGVKSVKSRVVNLSSLNPEINVSNMKTALIKAFELEYGSLKFIDDIEDINKYYEKYSSWDFLYGKNPKFDFEIEKRFAFGDVHICLKSQKGYITEATIYSDSMDEQLYQLVAKSVVGEKFSKQTIIYAFGNHVKNSDEAQSIISWLENAWD